MDICPKTFPEKLNYIWLENIGQPFENSITILKRVYFCFVKGDGVILNKSLYSETTYNKRNYSKDVLKGIRNLRKLIYIFKKDVFFVNDMWSTGPYHFYVDILSKLVELKKSEEFLSKKKITIVLFKNEFTYKVVLPILRQIGFAHVKLFLLEKNRFYLFIGKNYFVTKPHVSGTNNPIILNQVYQLLNNNIKKYSISDFGLPKVVYYYRKNRFRKVINDDKLLNVLTNMGVYCTTFDDLSYSDSIVLMNSVKVFVGIHGGGLTNMLFLKPGSSIIEIKNNNLNPNSHCYWHLARSLNFDYTIFVAETIGEKNIIEGNGCDVNVDIEKLTTLINSLSHSY